MPRSLTPRASTWSTSVLVEVSSCRALLDLIEHEPEPRDADLGRRLRPCAIELAARPAALPPVIEWVDEIPVEVVGLVLANEWLDNVPLDVVEVGPDGPRQVLVDTRSGAESPGGPAGMRDGAWLDRWWPLLGSAEGDRAEVGFTRDDAWAGAVRSLARGVAVAIDYGHLHRERTARAFAEGSLRGYRGGRLVPPVPDGSCDLTAHVAIDACAAAGQEAGATTTVLLRQKDALRQLGVVHGELTDSNGLGAFWWLVQAVDCTAPLSIVASASQRQAASPDRRLP